MTVRPGGEDGSVGLGRDPQDYGKKESCFVLLTSISTASGHRGEQALKGLPGSHP